jgi:hypothetical protein
MKYNNYTEEEAEAELLLIQSNTWASSEN